MEHPALGLVLLLGILAAGSSLRQQDLNTVKVMDMAPNCFDDQYCGCSHMMEEELEELNRTEFANNGVYAKAWTIAAAEWRSRQGRVPQTLRPELAIALLTYTQESPLHGVFNRAVREAGRSRQYYLRDFHFKVLHFLLSEALRTLRDAGPHRCYSVYWGVQNIRFTALHHQSVRFGHFTSASLKQSGAKYFGPDTFFLVETCYGVPIRNFSFYPNKEEVLIPPFETYKVINVARDRERAVIQLRSQAVRSTYNCTFVEGPLPTPPAATGSSSPTSPGRIIPVDPPHLWVLLLAATALAA
ncbi:NARE ribosyltransferase, partial [Eurystomus gularis]|nr:NARE ribosyltransferase [Eurystomus gularis]